MSTSARRWPKLSYDEWRETCTALHLWSQIAGKYRLAHAPWVNHSWHATLYVTPRGLTTGLVPDAEHFISLDFDFYEHRFMARADGGAVKAFPLEAMTVSDFFGRAKEAITAVGGSPTMHDAPNEVPDPVAFADDAKQRPYDRSAVERFHQALLSIERVFSHFRTSFIGKVSPVHLFWGAFDLAVTRFSGRRAPPHPGGVQALPDSVTREAYSHEVSSAGFWPGGAGADDAMFYSYAYPEPDGFKTWEVQPGSAFYDSNLREFLVPYEAVRSAEDPDGVLMTFLESTYEAAAASGQWDRTKLECETGRPRVPRRVGVPEFTDFRGASNRH
jgi:hypothetical protein